MPRVSAVGTGRRAARGPAAGAAARWEPRGEEPRARRTGARARRPRLAAPAPAPTRDGVRTPHTHSHRAARGQPTRQRPRAVAGRAGEPPAGRAGPTGGRRYLCQGELGCRSHGVSIMHGRGRKDGRTGARGGKEAEGQAVGEAGGRASPRTSTTSLLPPPRPAPPASQAVAARKARRGSLSRGTRP